MEMREPGIDGTYGGSCVACFAGTDTGLAFSGPAEWAVAGLLVLGIPQEQGAVLVGEATGAPPGQVPVGDVVVAFRICQPCADRSGTGMPVGLITSVGMPTVSCPQDRY